MKMKAKRKDCHLVIRAKAAPGESIHEKELDTFARMYLRGFLKPRLIKKNQIEYTGPIGISLYERFKKPLTERDFFFLMEQVVVAVQKLQANSLPLNNLLTDIRYVYINDVTKEVQFIYIPITPPPNGKIMELIESIIYSVHPAQERDRDFVSRFVYFFRAMKPFDIDLIEKYIAKEDESVVTTIKKQHAGQSGFMTNKQRHYYEHYGGQSTADDEPTDLLHEDDGATGLLGDEATGLLDDEATGLLTEEDEATGLLTDNTSSEDTALLSENQANIRYPTLYRILTEETISINKPVFRLGKGKSYVDYFVTNNIAVSRSHADIVTRGNHFFVTDLNSKNHTYINGRELPVHCEMEINDGDRLKLGNEEFIFHIERRRGE